MGPPPIERDVITPDIVEASIWVVGRCPVWKSSAPS